MNIILIGMVGVGKSVIGEKLARMLRYQFIDVDLLIENDKKLSLQEIIDSLGEEEFLKIEERAVLKLKGVNRCVISPGGSVVYSAQAMQCLTENSRTVFLEDSLANIRKRLLNPSMRGIVGLKNKQLKEIFIERVPLYQKYANLTIKIPQDFNTDQAVQIILKKLNREF